MSAVAHEPGRLIFAWDRVRRVPIVLPGFLLLSLAAHIATFFLFQVVYPERVTIPAPAPSVSVLDPARPEHQALLRLIEAEDPAPVAASFAAVPKALLEVPYRPSYATVRTWPQTLPEAPSGVQYPPARDPLAIIRSSRAPARSSPPPQTPSTTQVRFSGELAARALRQPLQFSTNTRASDVLQSAVFLIGVADRGEVRFAFLQRSSGDPAIDEAGATALAKLTFEPSENTITWAHATLAWGDDVYPPPPKP